MHLGSLWTLVLPIFLWAIRSGADKPSWIKDEEFMKGGHGTYPRHHFKTSIIEPPRLNFEAPFAAGSGGDCDDGSYMFVAPRGNVVGQSFYILDLDGHMIWGPDHKYGQVYNFQVQYYKGEPYLFFWAGDDSVGGHGEGKYYMLDQHYEEHHTISAGDGIRGDLHAFFITEEQTAVFTGYQVVQADLTSMGKDQDSWIWESLFQELDIDTGEVLFEWRASQHFDFDKSFVSPNAATHGNPWDFFHINMVDKDKEGNYLVSTRYGRCVLYISKETGEILWQLGGKENSFKDLSNGDATTFLGQHDAHWVDGHDAISMFDNRADWFNKIEDESVGHRIHIDLDAMTAELVHSYRHPNHILSTSQGSMQTLPNGNVLMGYGFNGVFTEYAPDGSMLCDAYMMSPKRFGSGDVQSYRNLKFNWTGIPLTTPDLHYQKDEQTLYMSWLGSTKLRSWTLQDCDAADGIFESVQTARKNGFETEFNLTEGYRMRRYVRVIAVDQGGTQLAISNPVDLLDPFEIWGEPQAGEELHHTLEPTDQVSPETSSSGGDSSSSYVSDKDVEDVRILLVLGVLLLISAALVAWMVFGGGCIPWRRSGGASEKTYLGATRFRDDGRWRRLLHRIRMQFPGMRRSWRYGQVPTRQDEDEERVPFSGPPIFDRSAETAAGAEQ